MQIIGLARVSLSGCIVVTLECLNNFFGTFQFSAERLHMNVMHK